MGVRAFALLVLKMSCSCSSMLGSRSAHGGPGQEFLRRIHIQDQQVMHISPRAHRQGKPAWDGQSIDSTSDLKIDTAYIMFIKYIKTYGNDVIRTYMNMSMACFFSSCFEKLFGGAFSSSDLAQSGSRGSHIERHRHEEVSRSSTGENQMHVKAANKWLVDRPCSKPRFGSNFSRISRLWRFVQPIKNCMKLIRKSVKTIVCALSNLFNKCAKACAHLYITIPTTHENQIWLAAYGALFRQKLTNVYNLLKSMHSQWKIRCFLCRWLFSFVWLQLGTMKSVWDHVGEDVPRASQPTRSQKST